MASLGPQSALTTEFWCHDDVVPLCKHRSSIKDQIFLKDVLTLYFAVLPTPLSCSLLPWISGQGTWFSCWIWKREMSPSDGLWIMLGFGCWMLAGWHVTFLTMLSTWKIWSVVLVFLLLDIWRIYFMIMLLCKNWNLFTFLIHDRIHVQILWVLPFSSTSKLWLDFIWIDLCVG